MVRGGTGHIKGGEGVAVIQPPVDYALDRCDAVILHVVLKHEAVAVARRRVAALGDVRVDAVCGLGVPRVVAVNVPVEVLVAHIVHDIHKAAHNAGVELADRVGAAAGEAAELRVLPGLTVDDVLYRVEVFKERLLAGVYLAVVMRIGVHGDAVPLVVGAAYHILIIGIQRRDEECRLDAVARQHVQQLRRVGAGAVVKGEIDGLRVVGLDAVGLLRGNNVYVPLRRRSVPAVIRDRICERIAADFVRDYISADLHAVGEVVALRVMRFVARLLKARTCDKLQLRVAAERQHRRADDDALDACLVAGGIAHGVDDAGVGHGALDLVGDVAVIIVARGVALCLAVLRHHIQYQRLHGAAAPDRIRDAVHKEIWDDARIEAPRPEDDQIGPGNGLQTVRQRLRVLRHKAHLPDAAVVLFFRVVNFALAEAAGAVFKFGLKMHVLIRHRQHAARDRQYLSHHGDGLFKAPRHAVERRKQQISERLPLELSLGKAIAEKLLHHRLGIRERLHTLPHVTRRQNTHFTAQHAAPAAVVRHRDDGR